MSKQVIPLLLHLDVEVTDYTPEIVAAVLEDIDHRITGHGREIRARHPEGGWHYVDYQVKAVHGEKRTP